MKDENIFSTTVLLEFSRAFKHIYIVWCIAYKLRRSQFFIISPWLFAKQRSRVYMRRRGHRSNLSNLWHSAIIPFYTSNMSNVNRLQDCHHSYKCSPSHCWSKGHSHVPSFHQNFNLISLWGLLSYSVNSWVRRSRYSMNFTLFHFGFLVYLSFLIKVGKCLCEWFLQLTVPVKYEN